MGQQSSDAAPCGEVSGRMNTEKTFNIAFMNRGAEVENYSPKERSEIQKKTYGHY